MLRELQETNAALQDVRELLRQQVRARVGRQGVRGRGERPGRGGGRRMGGGPGGEGEGSGYQIRGGS